LGNAITAPYASVTGGADNSASGSETSVTGGLNNDAVGTESSVVGGEENISADPLSMVGGGCDDVAGTVTGNTATCAAGGEAVTGGAHVGYSVTDGTAGLISEIVDEDNIPISFTLAAAACGTLNLSIPQAKVGDQALITYPSSPPPAQMMFSTPDVTSSGTVLVPNCNKGASSVTYSGVVDLRLFR
jgi:hypothetical protein